jgi:glycosyltransferase involved in cell wall biosynthesis
MFLAETPEQAYSDPWALPLPQRLHQLGRGQRRVAYYYEEANTSTFRYRCYNMAQVLTGAEQVDVPEFSACWFHRADLEQAAEEIAACADVLVVCRSGYESRLLRLIQAFRARGKRVLFDVDDLVFDTRYAHLVMNTLDRDIDAAIWWDFWFGYLGRMRATLDLCDGAITTNAFLAARLAECTSQPVAVVPNFINREQRAISDQVWQSKADSGFARNGEFTLGYFSGSPSHNHDYGLVEPAIAALMARRPELRLLTVGYIEPGPHLQPFKDRLQHAPFQDWVNLQRLVGSVEVNLMPLAASVFTDCKSPLKYFESAIVGTLSIASPSINYADAIRHGVNGYLARGHEWEQQIEQVIDTLQRYPEMARQARHDALARFDGPAQRAALLAALGWA